MSGNSPAPGTPQTAAKAIFAAIGAFVGTFVVSLWATLQGRTDLDTMKAIDWLIVILGSIATTIAAGGFAYQVRNRAL